MTRRTLLRRPRLLVAVVGAGVLLAACGADPIDTVHIGAGPGTGEEAGVPDEVEPGPLELVGADAGPLEVGEATAGGAIAATSSGVPVAVDAIPIASARFADLELPRRPAALRIDGLGIDAPIITAGVAENGEMELPGAVEAAWYKHGPLPGDDAGSAVIAAHVDWSGRPGPFFGLRELPSGSVVVVTFDDGSEQRYRTVDTAQYAKDDLPIDDIFRRDGEHSLALVTCGGSFDASERSYSDNVVTIAVPIGPASPPTSATTPPT